MRKLDSARKVLPLVRVSTKGQGNEDRGGIPRQLEDVQEYCSEFNLEPVDTLELHVSGAYVQDSPDFVKMLGRLSDPSISGVVVATIDRFFRPASFEAYHLTLTPFVRNKKLLFCDKGSIDPSTPEGMAIIFAAGQEANNERLKIRKRTVRGKERNRLNPAKNTDRPPKGVTFHDGIFAYGPESVRVKEAFYRVVKGETLAGITRDLKFTSQQALRYTLQSHMWIGVKAALRNCEGGIRRKRESPVLTETNLAKTPLVPRAIFDQVQDILKQRTVTWSQQKSHDNEFLGSNLLYCKCGLKLYTIAPKKGTPKAYYYCKSNSKNPLKPCGNPMIRADKADLQITWSILSSLADEEFCYRKAIESLSTEQAEANLREIKTQEKALKDIERKMANAEEMAADRGYTETTKRLLAALDAQTTATKASLRKLRSEAPAPVDPRVVAKELRSKFFDFRRLPKAEQKALLAKYVPYISFDGRGHAVFVVRCGLPAQTANIAESNARTRTELIAGSTPPSVIDDLIYSTSQSPSWWTWRFSMDVSQAN